MSLKYAEDRIREALELSGGNATKAHKQVLSWARQDAKLLEALTDHHLNGIVAYHVERVASGRSDKAKAKPKAPARPASKPKTASGKKEKSFGMEVLKAVTRPDAAIFGLETYSQPPARGKASASHIDAIHKLTKKPKDQ